MIQDIPLASSNTTLSSETLVELPQVPPAEMTDGAAKAEEPTSPASLDGGSPRVAEELPVTDVESTRPTCCAHSDPGGNEKPGDSESNNHRDAHSSTVPIIATPGDGKPFTTDRSVFPMVSHNPQVNDNIAKVDEVDNFCSPENKAFYESAVYQPLDNGAQEIRMLAMSMGQQGRGQLELELEDNMPLSHFRDLVFALSYAAGSPTQTEVVRISAADTTSDFNAFSNLAKAMRAIRDLEFDASATDASQCQRTIWADQICINQSDPDERAYQVEHMREIYQAARLTIIYLGEDEDDGRGMRYLKSITDYCREGIGLPSDNGWVDLLNQAAEWIVNHVWTSGHAEDWRAVRTILEAPWWERGWVCQEAIVSNDAVILYGSSSMPLAHFALAVKAFTRANRNLLFELFEQAKKNGAASVDEALVDLTRAFDTTHVRFILNCSEDWAERKGEPFDDLKPLLRHARNCQTGDPRDRVYAFIGLAAPAYGIKPNYRITVSETFSQTAACIMRKEKSLEVVFDAMDNSGMLTLPSWVADWSSPAQRSERLFHRGYSASADYPGRAEIAFPGASGHVLRIQVLRLGRLSVPERFGPAEQATYSGWQSIAGFQGYEMHDDLYIGGGRLEDAFVSTLLFGRELDDDVGLDDLVGAQASTASRAKSLRKSMQHEEALDGQWSFFVTAGGYMGLAVPKARHDDYLCIALGASVPMVLRKQEDCYSFVGEAYVHGMMHGEAIELMHSGDLQLREVDVI